MNKNREKENLQKLWNAHPIWAFFLHLMLLLLTLLSDCIETMSTKISIVGKEALLSRWEWGVTLSSCILLKTLLFHWVALNMSYQRREAELKPSILNHFLGNNYCLFFLLTSIKFWLKKREWEEVGRTGVKEKGYRGRRCSCREKRQSFLKGAGGI